LGKNNDYDNVIQVDFTLSSLAGLHGEQQSYDSALSAWNDFGKVFYDLVVVCTAQFNTRYLYSPAFVHGLRHGES